MKAKRSVLLGVLILAVVAVALVMPSVAQAKHAENTIIVGTDPYYPPFENLKNGKIIGFDIDLVREIGERTGYKIEFQAEEWDKLITPSLTVQPYVFDMVASALTIRPDREEIMDFSDPYFYDEAYDSYYGFGFPTGSPLREIVNGALQEIMNDGSYAKIYRQWFDAKAQFGITARGDCLVDLPAGNPVYREYVEVAAGSLSCNGEGLINGRTEFKGMPVYELEPTSLRVAGSVRAAWSTDDGVNYEFRARLYATPETPAFFGCVTDHIIVGNSLGEPWTLLRYSGLFRVGAEQTLVEGYCCLAAGSNEENSVVTLKFITPDYQPFGLTWAKEAGVVDLWGPYDAECPAAEALDYWVRTK